MHVTVNKLGRCWMHRFQIENSSCRVYCWLFCVTWASSLVTILTQKWAGVLSLSVSFSDVRLLLKPVLNSKQTTRPATPSSCAPEITWLYSAYYFLLRTGWAVDNVPFKRVFFHFNCLPLWRLLYEKLDKPTPPEQWREYELGKCPLSIAFTNKSTFLSS